MDTTCKHRLYFAAPLFSTVEKEFNHTLAVQLEEYFEVILPQRDGGLLTELAKTMPLAEAKHAVFEKDTHAIDRCDVLLAVLDGRVPDEGVCWELGYAYCRGKTCIGLQTDPRRLLPLGNNPMIDRSLLHVLEDRTAVLAWAKEYMLDFGGG